MIFLDEVGYPVNESQDGMDSAVRAGILGTFSKMNLVSYLPQYEIKPGLLVRHPTHVPSNNPWNFTRDQMMCLVAALPAIIVRRVFWKCLLRFCFAQNFERDLPGTTKYPWPHIMQGGDPVDNGKLRYFDFADPLLPHHMCHLIRCGRMYPLYPLLLIGNLFLLLSVLFNSQDLKSEQNQLQCMVYRAGKFWTWLYKKCNPNWKAQTIRYWDTRNEVEYANYIIGALE